MCYTHNFSFLWLLFKKTSSICYLKIILIEYLILLNFNIQSQSCRGPGGLVPRGSTSGEPLWQSFSVSNHSLHFLAPTPFLTLFNLLLPPSSLLLTLILLSPFYETVMVNFMCHIDLATGCQDVWLNMISEWVHRSVFGWDYFWISGQSKADCPPPNEWASSSQLKAWLDKSLRKHFLSVSVQARSSPTFGFKYGLGITAFQFLRFWIITKASLLGLYCSVFIITWVNSYIFEYKDCYSYIGPAQIIQPNFLILKSLI